MSEKYEAVLAGRRFTIEQDLPEVGWYLQEFENGVSVSDYLQDSIELAIQCATQVYGVPAEAWKKI